MFCQLFHEQKIEKIKFHDGILLWDEVTYLGCTKCDLWRVIEQEKKPNT